MSDVTSSLVDTAYEAAKDAYEEAAETHPAGYSYVIAPAVVRDKALLRQLALKPHFEVHRSGVATIHLDFADGKSIERNYYAHKAFLEELQDMGRLTGARVFKPDSVQ